MIYPVYCIRDAVLDAFEPPFVALHDAAASRSFRNALDDPDSPYSKNRADYSLWRLGEFDTDAGLTAAPPVRLMTGFGGDTIEKEV